MAVSQPALSGAVADSDLATLLEDITAPQEGCDVSQALALLCVLAPRLTAPQLELVDDRLLPALINLLAATDEPIVQV